MTPRLTGHEISDEVEAEGRRVIAGRYSLKDEVGRGGMGIVWRGEDELLGREVALKRVGVLPGGASPDLARAEREARLAASLNHPHVVSVFDLVDEADAQWLVMEYVESKTLSELVQEHGPLAPDHAAGILCQAADALAAAHTAGIVHRDVKPSNILVTPHGQAKLTDFGIARATADATLTQTGLVTGSPAYLSPEVATGATATAATDVWSLGATLFHALTGRPPYDVQDNLVGALYQIVHEPPPRPENAGWLLPLFEHTMVRDPADRWPMEQVRAFLAREHHEQPVPSGPATAVIPPPPPSRGGPDGPPSRIAPTPVPARRQHGPSRALRVAALTLAGLTLAVVALVLLSWLLLGTGDGDRDQTPAKSSSSPSQQAEETGTSAAPVVPTARGMRAFARDYLATAPSDSATSWEMLTPGFQAESNGFGGYRSFWSTIRSATPVTVTADPRAMTVRYTVAYLKKDGSSFDDEVVLTLAFEDGRYLIAGEPTR
jgi:serine/threonine protein kinase